MGIKQIIFVFFYYLACGTFISFGVIRQVELGRRYFIYHGLGAIVISLLSFFLVGRSFLDPEAAYWLIASVCFMTLFSLTVGTRHRSTYFWWRKNLSLKSGMQLNSIVSMTSTGGKWSSVSDYDRRFSVYRIDPPQPGRPQASDAAAFFAII